MSKRNIAYVKPEEPNFLKRLKAQAGYKEGPTVDTKREESAASIDDDFEIAEEEPTVVVLKPGDLTAEEAEAVKLQLEKAEADKPADLSERVVFRRPNKSAKPESDQSVGTVSKAKTAKKTKVVLSFDDDDADD